MAKYPIWMSRVPQASGSRLAVPPRKNLVIPFTSTILCNRYIVMEFIPTTWKNNTPFLHPLTSIR